MRSESEAMLTSLGRVERQRAQPEVHGLSRNLAYDTQSSVLLKTAVNRTHQDSFVPGLRQWKGNTFTKFQPAEAQDLIQRLKGSQKWPDSRTN